jgi:hypothetical protein
MDAEGQLEELVSFADEIGLLYEDLGAPRIWGRVLGWLLTCQPNYQSGNYSPGRWLEQFGSRPAGSGCSG